MRDDEECRKVGAEFFNIPCRTEDEVIAAAQDADAVITHSVPILVPFTRKVISKLNKCKVIHNIGAGYEGIDVLSSNGLRHLCFFSRGLLLRRSG